MSLLGSAASGKPSYRALLRPNVSDDQRLRPDTFVARRGARCPTNFSLSLIGRPIENSRQLKFVGHSLKGENMATKIFVNLPVKDLNKSIGFFIWELIYMEPGPLNQGS